MLKLSFIFLAPVLAMSSASGADVDWPGLPPTSAVEQALSGQIRVQEAMAMLEAARAKAAGLSAGSHEWTARAGLAKRNVDVGATERYTEAEVALEKAFRLPGKAALDERMGQALVLQAKFAVGDAMHESARELLAAWFEYASAGESVALWQEQNKLLQKQLEIVDKRIRAGDAPRLEREAVRAALAQSKSQAAQAELKRDAALAMLKARYPQLPLNLTGKTEPLQLDKLGDGWRQAVLDDNHELAQAVAAAQFAELQAERQHANLNPDPTLGLRYSSERGGEESVLGAYISVTLPGSMRRAERNAARAESQSARLRADAVRARLMLDAESLYLAASRYHAAWLNAREAADAFLNQAEGAQRAYQLGEGNLSESLTAQRLALDARLNETQARVDAQRAVYRLKLDIHQLWDLHLAE